MTSCSDTALEAAMAKKALGMLRANLIAELWPEKKCSYFKLDTWAQEYLDMLVAKGTTK